MKILKHLFYVFLLAVSFQAHALVITSTSYNVELPLGYSYITADMKSLGYNPKTDTMNYASLSLHFREIIDNGDDWDAGTNEMIILYTPMFGIGREVYGNMDTQVVSHSRDSFDEYTCLNWDEWGNCSWDIVETGKFGIILDVYTENLILDKVYWSLDVTRAEVDEPSTGILLALGLMVLCVLRSDKLTPNRKNGARTEAKRVLQ